MSDGGREHGDVELAQFRRRASSSALHPLSPATRASRDAYAPPDAPAPAPAFPDDAAAAAAAAATAAAEAEAQLRRERRRVGGAAMQKDDAEGDAGGGAGAGGAGAGVGAGVGVGDAVGGAGAQVGTADSASSSSLSAASGGAAPLVPEASWRDAMVRVCADLLGKSLDELEADFDAGGVCGAGPHAPRDLADYAIMTTLRTRDTFAMQNAPSWLFNVMDRSGAGFVLREEFVRYTPFMSIVADAAVAGVVFDELLRAQVALAARKEKEDGRGRGGEREGERNRELEREQERRRSVRGSVVAARGRARVFGRGGAVVGAFAESSRLQRTRDKTVASLADPVGALRRRRRRLREGQPGFVGGSSGGGDAAALGQSDVVEEEHDVGHHSTSSASSELLQEAIVQPDVGNEHGESGDVRGSSISYDEEEQPRPPLEHLYPISAALRFSTWKHYFDSIQAKWNAKDEDWDRVKRELGLDPAERLVKAQGAVDHSDIWPTLGKLFLSQRYLVFYAAVGRNHYVARLGAVSEVGIRPLPLLMRDCLTVTLESETQAAMNGISQAAEKTPRRQSLSSSPKASRAVGSGNVGSSEGSGTRTGGDGAVANGNSAERRRGAGIPSISLGPSHVVRDPRNALPVPGSDGEGGHPESSRGQYGGDPSVPAQSPTSATQLLHARSKQSYGASSSASSTSHRAGEQRHGDNSGNNSGIGVDGDVGDGNVCVYYDEEDDEDEEQAAAESAETGGSRGGGEGGGGWGRDVPMPQHVVNVMRRFTAGSKPLVFSLIEFREAVRRDHWVNVIREMVAAHRLHLTLGFGSSGRVVPEVYLQGDPSGQVESNESSGKDRNGNSKKESNYLLYLASPFRNEPPPPLLAVAAHSNIVRYRAVKVVQGARDPSMLLVFSNAERCTTAVSWYVDSVRARDDRGGRSWIERAMDAIRENMEINKRVYNVQDDEPFDVARLGEGIGRLAELCTPLVRVIQYWNHIIQWRNPPATFIALATCLYCAYAKLIVYLPGLILFALAGVIVATRTKAFGLDTWLWGGGRPEDAAQRQANVLELVAQVHNTLGALQNGIKRINTLLGKVQTLCLWGTGNEDQSWIAVFVLCVIGLLLVFADARIVWSIVVWAVFSKHFMPPRNPLRRFWGAVPERVLGAAETRPTERKRRRLIRRKR